MTKPKEGAIHSSVIGQKNRTAILKAMPATGDEISQKTGINRATVNNIIKKLRRAGDCAIVSTTPRTTRQGRPIAVFGEIENARNQPARIIAPLTKYRTQFIGANPWGMSCAL